jgi:hypothetical protein
VGVARQIAQHLAGPSERLLERHKSLAQDCRRCQIQRRHRSPRSAGKPRRLIAPHHLNSCTDTASKTFMRCGPLSRCQSRTHT